MRRAPGVVERIHVRLRWKQPRHGPYALPRRSPTLAGSQVERVACPWRTLSPGRYRFPAGLRNEYEQAPTERYNRALTYFDPGAQLPIAAGAQAAYAANPVPELPASGFTVQGGSVYAGVNGAPRQPWQNELMWLPRVSAAWQFSRKMILRGGYGVYYDSINVQNLTLNQSGFSKTTSTNLTNDFGVNWLAGNPRA